MKKEWVLTLVSTVVTLAIALFAIRVFVPGLLGIIPGQAIVQIDEKVPPFYEHVIRFSDLGSKRFLINDPLSQVRAKPLFPATLKMGPNDILGFRNPAVPNMTDIIVIGDSQAYGNNVPLSFTFPSQISSFLNKKYASVYNMSTGGWGAVQYLYIFSKAWVFRPRVVVIAFYTGNDAVDSFKLAYAIPQWKLLRPDKSLTINSLPKIKFPPPPSELWRVKFKDGITSVFTPTLRLGANQNHPAIQAGYQIMADSASRIAELAKQMPLKVVFTIIPTKEYAYYNKLKTSGISLPEAYVQLIKNEKIHIQTLEKHIRNIANVQYVDVITLLQKEAMKPVMLYAPDKDGHPIYLGYKVIARTLANEISKHLQSKLDGEVRYRQDNEIRHAYIKGNKVWYISNIKPSSSRGVKTPMVDYRTISGLRLMGIIDR